MRERYPYVVGMRRGGRTFWYFRHKSLGKLIRLPDNIASAEFATAWAECKRLLETAPPARQMAAGTLGWLIAEYRAHGMPANPRTRVSYDRELARLQPIERFPATNIKRIHINAIRDKLADKPRTQQLFGQVASALFAWGIRERDLDMSNPAKAMRRAGKAQSHRAWPLEVQRAFETSDPPPHVMRAYMLCLHTGCRRGDVVRLRQTDRQDGGILIPGNKTDEPVWVAEHPRLTAYLASVPLDFMLVGASEDRATKDLRRHMKGMGLSGYTLHGLRHTAGARMAEAGCSAEQIRAVLGHRTTQMTERYTRQARQRELAKGAIVRLTRENDE